MKCEDCSVNCPRTARWMAIDESTPKRWVYCDEHAPDRDPGVTLVAIPEDKRLTWDEKKAIWRDDDHRDPPRRRRAEADELAHSEAPHIDLDDPEKLAEEYWDIWS